MLSVAKAAPVCGKMPTKEQVSFAPVAQMGEGGKSASTARTRPNAASMQASGRTLRRRGRGVLGVTQVTLVRDMMRSKEQISFAPVAQMDRVLASEAKGHRFDSCRARQIQKGHP